MPSSFKAEMTLDTERRIENGRRKEYDRRTNSGERVRARATSPEFQAGYDKIKWGKKSPLKQVSSKLARKTYIVE
jgi:hypothetical protein